MTEIKIRNDVKLSPAIVSAYHDLVMHLRGVEVCLELLRQQRCSAKIVEHNGKWYADVKVIITSSAPLEPEG